MFPAEQTIEATFPTFRAHQLCGVSHDGLSSENDNRVCFSLSPLIYIPDQFESDRQHHGEGQGASGVHHELENV